MATTNLVGTVVPTEEETQQLHADIDKVQSAVECFGVIVAADDRGSFLKPKGGSEKLMPLVFEIATEKKVAVEGIPLAGMNDDLKVGQVAEKLELRFENLRQLAADTRLAAYGEAYQAFLAYYGVLSSMAKHDPALAKRLQPVIDFMSTGPRAKKAKP